MRRRGEKDKIKATINCSKSLNNKLRVIYFWVVKPPLHRAVSLLDLLWCVQPVQSTTQDVIHPPRYTKHISADEEM